ncbi:fibrous sheath CABYR-binding protein isoform X2 [Drosophila erecta]|nr:fibrous sheath CABYR-binding protein isoform X2 [Drosophila erecta]XP_026838741.1 fibrous sheath CABYR-binding protein isoform X2 [Drosophila erecta]
MRRILDELEEEVYEINGEQQFLLMRLNDDLGGFFMKLKENNIASLPEMANEYVSAQIVPLIADPNYKITPQSVVARDNEEMLIRKHFLLSQDDDAGVPPLKLSELDENIPLMLAPPVRGLGQQIAAAQPQVKWPKVEEAPAPVPPPPPQSQSELMKRSLDSAPPKRKNITCSSPPPLAPITQTVVAAVPPVPPPQPKNPPMDFEVVAQSRKNLHQALKRARKTKQQPRLFDEEEDMEITSLENSRKNKTSEGRKTPPSLELTNAATNQAANAVAKKSMPQMPSQGTAKNNSVKTRNTSRKSSPTPTTNTQPQPAISPSGSSDDSSAELQQEQQRLFASAAQWRDEPRESRTLPAEYGQETFLGLFGLYTPEVVKKLNQRHSKRKRRTVQNASGVDFHYGQQLNTVDSLVLGVRGHKKAKEKSEFLLSPNEKRLQANSKRTYTRKSKTPDKVTEKSGSAGGSGPSGNAVSACQHGDGGASKCRKCRECRECKRRVEPEAMYCHLCSGFYHMDCHEATKNRQQMQLQNSRCPPCLREQDKLPK